MNSRTTRLCSAAALVGIAVLVSSCASRESRPLARVGDHTITVGEFLDAARTSGGQYPWAPDSNKTVLLDDMIQRELLLLEAESRGMTSDSLLVGIRRQLEDELLLGAMTDRFAPDAVPVSAAEVEQFYEWSRVEGRVQLIVTETKPMAEAAMKRIREGENFGLVALQFNRTGLVPPDGDVGFLPAGSMLEPLDGLLREAAVAEAVGPVRMGENWVVARLLERREAEVPPRMMVEPQLQQQIRQRKQRILVQRAVEDLKLQYQLVLDPAAETTIFHRAAGPRDDAELPDEQIVLARYRVDGKDHTYTMADVLADLSAGNSPDFTSTAAIRRWLEAAIARRLVLLEARRQHLHEEPELALRIEQRLNNELLQSIYSSDVTSQILDLDDPALRAEYERRAGPGAPPFESLPPELREQLRSMALESKRDELLRNLTSSLRAKFPVVIDQERLARTDWPESPLPTTGG